MQPNVDRTFFLGAQRDPKTGLFIMSKYHPAGFMHLLITDSAFSLLKFIKSDDDTDCLAARIRWPPKYIEIFPTACDKKIADSYFCHSDVFETKDLCLLDADTIIDTMDVFLNRVYKDELDLDIVAKGHYFNETIKRLDWSASYPSLMRALWYTNLPCSDLKELTAHSKGTFLVHLFKSW
jgi:hypothetical protein